MNRLLACAAVMLPALAGCAGPSARDYAGTEPAMDMLAYFDGDVRAWGVVQDRSGRVLKQFTLVMHGTMQPDGSLAMHEELAYADGAKESRNWMVRRVDDHHVTAIANGVVGEAAGEQYGDALHLQYVLQVPMDGKSRDFSIDDWFYLQRDGVLINRSYGSKWGFHAFDVITSFQKGAPAP